MSAALKETGRGAATLPSLPLRRTLSGDALRSVHLALTMATKADLPPSIAKAVREAVILCLDNGTGAKPKKDTLHDNGPYLECRKAYGRAVQRAIRAWQYLGGSLDYGPVLGHGEAMRWTYAPGWRRRVMVPAEWVLYRDRSGKMIEDMRVKVWPAPCFFDGGRYPEGVREIGPNPQDRPLDRPCPTPSWEPERDTLSPPIP